MKILLPTRGVAMAGCGKKVLKTVRKNSIIQPLFPIAHEVQSSQRLTGIYHEKNIPAEHIEKSADTRLQSAHENQRRARGDQRTSSQRAQAVDSLIRVDQHFPKHTRLLNKPNYDRVFKKNTKIQDDLFLVLMHYSCAAEHARLGVVVSKKVNKRAVERNRIKRLIRETFRRHALPGADFVVIAKKNASRHNNGGLIESLNRLWLRATARKQHVKS